MPRLGVSGYRRLGYRAQPAPRPIALYRVPDLAAGGQPDPGGGAFIAGPLEHLQHQTGRGRTSPGPGDALKFGTSGQTVIRRAH
jgi:hypothetical protein